MDHSGFDALVRAYGTDLYRYALWLCGDPATAEDLVQEACMRAWRSRHKLRSEAAARRWVITILRREHLRRAGPSREIHVEIDPLAEGADACDVLAMRQAVAALDGMYREPLVLQIVWGFSAKEIAEILELTPQAVMTRTFRARAQLRELLDVPQGRRA